MSVTILIIICSLLARYRLTVLDTCSYGTAFNYNVERRFVYRLAVVGVVEYSRIIGSVKVDDGLGDIQGEVCLLFISGERGIFHGKKATDLERNGKRHARWFWRGTDRGFELRVAGRSSQECCSTAERIGDVVLKLGTVVIQL